MEVLALPCVDIVFLNEGVYALHHLLRGNLGSDLAKVRGIGYKKRGPRAAQPILWLNPPQAVVPQEPAWTSTCPATPGTCCRIASARWTCTARTSGTPASTMAKRTPFAAIYTSLGCNFGCDFCMINIVNRNDNGEEVHAAHSRGMRFWSPRWSPPSCEKLAKMGVETVRISDEMFFLNRRYYEPLLNNIVERDLKLRMWAYSRVDTVRPAALELFRKAGIGWLALGIEAGSQLVRKEVSKGSFQEVNIREICKTVRDADINVISNYIFGFPDDTLATMQQTLDLALELNTEMANMYPCQALPGSPIYRQAIRNGWKLPDSYAGYAFLSYDCEPLADQARDMRRRCCAFATRRSRPTSPTRPTWRSSNAASARRNVPTSRT
jgi:anaerobic magnesium-protoporphyrin IX monomethyl ester cyclase